MLPLRDFLEIPYDKLEEMNLKAKQEPDFCFDALYDKVCRPDILAHAQGQPPIDVQP